MAYATKLSDLVLHKAPLRATASMIEVIDTVSDAKGHIRCGAGEVWKLMFEQWLSDRAASPPAREEAPGEGAGEIEDILIDCFEPKAYGIPRANVASAVKRILALRNRTSEPEAGAVAWRAEKEKQTYLYDTDEEYRMHSARSLGFRITPLYTHPAPATADRLRVAVEALERTRDGLRAMADDGLIENDSWAEIDQALAALNEGGE